MLNELWFFDKYVDNIIAGSIANPIRKHLSVTTDGTFGSVSWNVRPNALDLDDFAWHPVTYVWTAQQRLWRDWWKAPGVQQVQQVTHPGNLHRQFHPGMPQCGPCIHKGKPTKFLSRTTEAFHPTSGIVRRQLGYSIAGNPIWTMQTCTEDILTRRGWNNISSYSTVGNKNHNFLDRTCFLFEYYRVQ